VLDPVQAATRRGALRLARVLDPRPGIAALLSLIAGHTRLATGVGLALVAIAAFALPDGEGMHGLLRPTDPSTPAFGGGEAQHGDGDEGGPGGAWRPSDDSIPFRAPSHASGSSWTSPNPSAPSYTPPAFGSGYSSPSSGYPSGGYGSTYGPPSGYANSNNAPNYGSLRSR
jgi:hypothetical protein